MIMESVMRIQVCKDPVTKMLLGRFGYKLVFIWFIFPILPILTSVHYETLTSMMLPSELSGESVKTLPLLKDEMFYSLLVVIPFVIILLNYFLTSIPDMVVALWENKVIQSRIEPEPSIKQYNAYLREFETKVNNKKEFSLISISIPIIILLSLYGYYKALTIEYPAVTSYDIRFFPLSGIVFYAAIVFLFYLVIPTLYKGFLSILLPRKLHREFSIRARPLHPDKCGGLKSLGDLCIRFDYIFLIGVVSSIFHLLLSEGTESEMYFYFFLAYAFLVTFFFLYPLWPIHNVMKVQKYDLLNKLNDTLDPLYLDIAGSADIDTKNLEKIDRMDMIYSRVSNMPVWPFDTGGLIRFLTTVCVPFVGIIVDTLIF